jgi:hypothetical protein
MYLYNNHYVYLFENVCVTFVVAKAVTAALSIFVYKIIQKTVKTSVTACA